MSYINSIRSMLRTMICFWASHVFIFITFKYCFGSGVSGKKVYLSIDPSPSPPSLYSIYLYRIALSVCPSLSCIGLFRTLLYPSVPHWICTFQYLSVPALPCICQSLTLPDLSVSFSSLSVCPALYHISYFFQNLLPFWSGKGCEVEILYEIDIHSNLIKSS